MNEPEYDLESLMQLFVEGPTWDGNLVSKEGRNSLVNAGLCNRHDGWNFLTTAGIDAAVEQGKNTQMWADQRWYHKATLR